jgi:hypothetical protein
MDRLVMGLSLLAISTLIFFGIVDPNSPAMWLASTSQTFTYIRIAMAAVLVALLITRPPRNHLFRIFVGVFSAILAYWSLRATYMNQMAFLDTMTILTFSISCGISVAELDETKVTRVRARGLRRFTTSIYAAYTLHNGKL